jgi:hypothetical protein
VLVEELLEDRRPVQRLHDLDSQVSGIGEAHVIA